MVNFVGSIIQGFVVLILLLVVGYFIFSNIGFALVAAGIGLAVFIIVRWILQATTKQDAEWEEL